MCRSWSVANTYCESRIPHRFGAQLAQIDGYACASVASLKPHCLRHHLSQVRVADPRRLRESVCGAKFRGNRLRCPQFRSRGVDSSASLLGSGDSREKGELEQPAVWRTERIPKLLPAFTVTFEIAVFEFNSRATRTL